MANITGKIAEVLFESSLDTIKDQTMLVDLVSRFEPEGGGMQNSNNVVWRPVEQQATILDGWDLTGQETGIIEETYPAILGTPKNDFVSVRADDMRDMDFWRRRGVRSGMQQATELNKTIANAIATQGSLAYKSAATSGYNFIAEAQAIMNEQQRNQTSRHFVLNDRDTLKFASDLAARQTLQGRPDEVWRTGQIGANVASFDVHTGSFLPTLAGGADPATTVTGNQSFAPQGGSVDAATGIVTNVDYRSATIAVAASASYNVGDKITFANGGTAVQAVGSSDKVATGQARTFTIVAKPTGTSITVYPKPIAVDDPALSTLQKAYANINTRILNGATVNRINTAASYKTNLFFDSDAVEVLSGSIPADLMSSFAGKKVISENMSNGQKMYMVYDGNINDMTFRYRMFTWWGVTVRDPMRCGVALSV